MEDKGAGRFGAKSEDKSKVKWKLFGTRTVNVAHAFNAQIEKKKNGKEREREREMPNPRSTGGSVPHEDEVR